ncbi:MAG: winged helix-turn-helix transcriptional regulator [Deltaproteobacteria bacterium]|nr:winged helix-turn-helix transcriptional regulator [Deltaproteobacteria bacterium]
MQKEDLHILRLMGEIDRTGNHSQRELSRRLNISLGLVNTFIKRLVNKGYFKVTTMPRNRVKYFLTPAGLARKSRLTVEYLRYSLDSYRDIKNLLLNKYRDMEKKNIKSILFYGAGEVAELAYLYLQLTNIRLAGIIDENGKDKKFFDLRITGNDSITKVNWDRILLTRLEKTEDDIRNLIDIGIDIERISTL